MNTPPALVLGCNTPHGIGVLSDWIEEQTGQAPDFFATSWSIGLANISTERGYHINVNEDARGNGFGFGSDGMYGYGTTSGEGFGCGFGDIRGDGFGCGNGYGYGNGNGSGYGKGSYKGQ